MTNSPFFSIIIAAFNAEDYIAETIRSVLMQSFVDYEIIVKDACSKDETLNRIPLSDKIKIISEKDLGIYDGMNTGIKEARGRYLCFLNCGDHFASEDVLLSVFNFIKNNNVSNRSVVYGNYFTKGMISILPQKLTKSFLLRRPLCHQTMFFSYSIFDEFGIYDLQYKILSDYDCTLKCFTNGVEFWHIDCVICTYLGDGFSTRSREKYLIENTNIQRKYFTRRELFLAKIRSIITLTRVRVFLASDNSPRFVRRIYRKFANRHNR